MATSEEISLYSRNQVVHSFITPQRTIRIDKHFSVDYRSEENSHDSLPVQLCDSYAKNSSKYAILRYVFIEVGQGKTFSSTIYYLTGKS